VRSWSDLFDDPDQLAIELSPLGIDRKVLARDICDVPGYEHLRSLTERQRLKVALQVFGDQRRPQPPQETRTLWHIFGHTPEWGRLPTLDDKPKTDDERRGPKELGIPERELWWIIDRRLENPGAHSRKWLAQETERREGLDYVPRDRLSPLVDWIDLHPQAAERAARLRVIPPEFRAGTLGPIPPGA
jgi:hypothetical protein